MPPPRFHSCCAGGATRAVTDTRKCPMSSLLQWPQQKNETHSKCWSGNPGSHIRHGNARCSRATTRRRPSTAPRMSAVASLYHHSRGSRGRMVARHPPSFARNRSRRGADARACRTRGRAASEHCWLQRGLDVLSKVRPNFVPDRALLSLQASVLPALRGA